MLEGQASDSNRFNLTARNYEGGVLSTAPRIGIDVVKFWADPYPALARLRREAPIAHVPQLGSNLLCKRDDIFISEKQIDVFSSDQPEGLMTKLMGHNMMSKRTWQNERMCCS
jgi:hypothetical protein